MKNISMMDLIRRITLPRQKIETYNSQKDEGPEMLKREEWNNHQL